jgi:hypothetical protein
VDIYPEEDDILPLPLSSQSSLSLFLLSKLQFNLEHLYETVVLFQVNYLNTSLIISYNTVLVSIILNNCDHESIVFVFVLMFAFIHG